MSPDDRRDPHTAQPSEGGSATEPLQSEKSVGELFNQVATDVGILLSTQIDLAKLELREEAVRAGRAARLLGAGVGAAAFTLLMASFAAAWGIGEGLDSPALGFLIVGAVYGIGAAVLLVGGRARVRNLNAIPRETVATLKDDVRWARQQAH